MVQPDCGVLYSQEKEARSEGHCNGDDPEDVMLSGARQSLEDTPSAPMSRTGRPAEGRWMRGHGGLRHGVQGRRAGCT